MPLLEDARDGYPELEFPPRLSVGVPPRPPKSFLRRWTVDLYLEGTKDDPDRRVLGGKGTRRWRDRQQNPRMPRWARLAAISKHKENLEQAFRHPDYRAAFDVQLDVPGLAGGMRLSTTHTMFSMRCHEPNLCCLDDTIRVFWTKKIFREDREAIQKVDRALTALGACRADFQALYGKVRSGQILGAFRERDREDIWSMVLSASVDRFIASLFSFFQDLNYPKNVADFVKRLIRSRLVAQSTLP
ncbi:hypothetical protein BJ875DRAFT_447230 [Amylocarpus encephaloides]|uniref:Uncharacterized protein n=1 Tax=Amylocarpus encephaloides TaxID=45428 RepID=A0A9P7Y7U2_9HELO|nr:hypothetical protein BJ875DRAFT_447230 [Amylocarpus encephaloides]